MKKILTGITSALLCTAMLAATAVSAVPTNTGADWISRIDSTLPLIGNELYFTLEDEAAKMAGGLLAEPASAPDLSAIMGHKAHGITAAVLNGTLTFTPPKEGNADALVRDILTKEVTPKHSALLNEVNNTYTVFINDHPECFWLSGYTKAYVNTEYSYSLDGIIRYTMTAYLIVYEDNGHSVFDIRYPEYRNRELIGKDVKLLDDTINKIFDIPYVSKCLTVEEKVRAFNNYLVSHNSFSSAAASDNAAHECLRALVGGTGTEGPVCDGYANAFKVLCDRAGIPCVTVFGNAVNKAKAGGDHTWNAVLIDGVWYIVDVTFNDPILAGSTAAISKYENENYILVGENTFISGTHLYRTHLRSDLIDYSGAAVSGIKANPVFSEKKYDRDLAIASAMPFKDVKEDETFYAGIEYCYDNLIMNGVTETAFDPRGTLTRAMIVTVLWRHFGAPAQNGDTAFSDVPRGQWYSEAIEWAEENGIVYGMGDGTYAPHAPVTREQALNILKRYSVFRNYKTSFAERSLSGYTFSDWAKDGISYAKEYGYLRLTRDLTAPATRAEIAEYMRNLFTVNPEV